ncbi:MAG TPA: DUF4388 domain-containing protein [Myxococcota bacterium]|nr:DUF4388 domain-containing protein [Myxococcota bacterium]
MDGLAGSVRTMPLRDLVLYLGSRQLSGTLMCEHDGACKTVTIHDGAAVMASSTDPNEHFGLMLVERGFINRQQLQRALAAAPSQQLGRALVSQGLLEEDAVRDMLVSKIRTTLASLFTWREGSFQFQASTPPDIDRAIPVRIGLVRLWQEIVQRTGELPSAEAIPQLPGWVAAAVSLPSPPEPPPVAEPEDFTDFPQQFRADVESRLAERGRGKRFPKDLQRRAVAYYHYRLAGGSFLSEVARELELPPPTLRRWVLDNPAPTVTVSGTWQPASSAEPGKPVLVGPGGLRIEGLDLDSLAELLRRLD